jgi:cobalamin biosynthesis protein CbiD
MPWPNGASVESIVQPWSENEVIAAIRQELRTELPAMLTEVLGRIVENAVKERTYATTEERRQITAWIMGVIDKHCPPEETPIADNVQPIRP